MVVVWSSFNQVNSNSLLDVYGKILSPSGATVSNTFLVNQFTNYNQRTPAVTALKGGRFVVAWVSEQQRTKSATTIDETNGTYVTQINTASVDIYARLFQSNGAPAAGEFLVSTSSLHCANPSLAAGSDGGFMVAWSGRDVVVITNGWDVYGRPFGSNAVGGATVRLNSYLAEAQYAPHLSAIGEYFLAVWTSMGQDGSGEGVYGQFVRNNATLVGSEFRVNTTTVGRQMHPAVASDGANQFMAVWTSYTSITNLPHSYDLYAQRYQNVAAVLATMSAPYVWAPFTLSNNIYQPQLVVTWAPVAGLSVADYEVYVDGGSSATGVVTSNVWTMTSADGLSTNSTHSFTVDYLLTDGRRSPISASTSGSTWLGGNYYGIPSEWMYEYFGYSYSDWPKASVALDSSGYTLYQVFICGGNPLDASTWLKQTLSRNSEGLFLSWNTQEGAIYQVLVSTNMTTWDSFGSPRFAAGTNDSVNVSGSKAGYYRVNLLR